MRVWRNEAEYDLGPCVAALGMFDGVHIGHQALIRRAQELARELGSACIVHTFDCHPLSLLCPERAPKQLLSLEERLEKFEKLGVDGVLVQSFTAEFSATDPRAFLEGLAARLQLRGVVAGFNYSFGAGGRGNAALLRGEAQRLGYECLIIDPVTEEGETVSSTLIRRLISNGEGERAKRLMGVQTR